MESDVSSKNVILYLDDDDYNLILFQEFMKDEYQVLTALTQAEAYRLLKENPVKILISDQRMPGETGLEFLERITPEFPHVIKMIYTAHVDHEATIKAINLGGIYRYIMKPWNFEEMNQTLMNAIWEYDLRIENQNLIKQLKLQHAVLEDAYLQLRESEKKFTGIFQASADGIILLKEKTILEVNQAFLAIAGLPGKDIPKEVVQQYIEKEMPEIFKISSEDPAKFPTPFEFAILTSDKKQKFMEVNSRTFVLEGMVLVLVILRDVTERKMMNQKIMDAIFQTQEETQSRYAQELHDGLGPLLSTLKMYMEWLSNDKNQINKELINQKALQAIDEAISQTKEIANNLSPHVLQRFGLVNALKNYADGVRETHNISITILSKITDRLSPNYEIMLYRILLECIHNSVKHAKPETIAIQLHKQFQKILVSYTDNGKGFDVEKTLKETHGMGLFNIQNRIKLVGGEINIRSVVGRGTRIDITLTNGI